MPGPSGTTYTPKKERFTLQSSDISNQYIDLSELVVAESLIFSFDGLIQDESLEYTTSSVGGVTRVTFIGDLATGGFSALVTGDLVSFQYLYLG